MTEVLDCGHEPSKHHEFTTGHGTMPDGSKHCYACIASIDKASMIEHGHSKHLPLYLSNREVTNWPGSLRFKVYFQKEGRHNIAGRRLDVYFTGPEGARWHGTLYGEWTQVVHCKRMKGAIS